VNNELLAALQRLQSTPFHMPGHKRNTALLGGALPYALDITEIEDFDNLQHPAGLLQDIAGRAAALWGSDAAYCSVNGSTGAILAGIRALTCPGDTVLVARNCHMSVFHALELCRLRPVFLEPDPVPGWEGELHGAIAQSTLDKALQAHRNAALCVLTSPTYEGVVSRVHCPVPLLVDAAHGAHLPLPQADLVVMSLHKTLPALTQTALLHVCGPRVNRSLLEHNLRVFQTSSPSYVLLCSVAECIGLLEQHKIAWFSQWQARLDAFFAHAARWRRLRLLAPDDRSKLCVDAGNGAHAAAFLRARGIEPEYARGRCVLLLTSPCDTEAMMACLAEALDALDAQPAPPPAAPAAILPAAPCPVTPAFALLPPAACLGRVAAEYLWQYPPGIPLCIPGQVITQVIAGRDQIAVQTAVEEFLNF
jgi:arginine/lysine/ornithine decarboxylase